MNCQFSFGPNRSYFCSAETVYAWSDNNLPRELARLLEDSAHPQALDTPYDVAFPMEAGTYAICWKTAKGEDWYEDGSLGPAYGRLARFIKNVATKGGHTTRTVFGPNASFFSTSAAGYCWQNLPPGLEEDMQTGMKIRRPTCVALGVQGSYVVLYNDGTVTFDLRGQYPLVEGMIRNVQEAARRRGVMYVALNPFVGGEFYAVYGDGSASWNFPTAWSADVTAISREIKPVQPPPAPVTAASPGGTGGKPVPATPMPVPVSSGGTGPAPAPLPSPPPTSSGGTMSSISSVVGQAIEVVTQEAAAAPPAYAPIAHPHPVQIAHSQPAYAAYPQAVQRPPATAAAPAHKINWQEGLSMGLKAAQGINKIANVFQDPSQAQGVDAGSVLNFAQTALNFGNTQAGQAQQGSDQQSLDVGDVLNLAQNLNAFNFGDMQAGLQNTGADQVVVQETIYDNGNTMTVVDTVTWQNN
ncbi:hypothetical protein B0H19DRAFT_1193388 [Mycena capillaripes]|nr:hypothetical protein B0H19DRAFT_1193388 [Mycena capillaripes]